MRTMVIVPSSRTKKHSAGSPSTDTSAPAGQLDDVAVAGHPGQLLVVEVLEEEELAQLVGRQPLLRAWSSLPQVPVHEGDRHRALADGRGHPLHRVGPDVAGDEDAGEAGLQEVRVAVGRPARWPAALGRAAPGRSG